jgi:hypothetical protein
MATEVRVRNPAPRDMGAGVFADITPATFTVSWEPPVLVLTFDADLTPAQVLSVHLRARALDANEETILRAAYNALQTNRDYLALNPASTLQAIAQVTALTRQMNSVIRRVIGLYDGTD